MNPVNRTNLLDSNDCLESYPPTHKFSQGLGFLPVTEGKETDESKVFFKLLKLLSLIADLSLFINFGRE